MALQIKFWQGYRQVSDLRALVEIQEQDNARLRARNEALAAEVEDLRAGLEAVEERARAELGLIREGEEFYLIVAPEDLDPQVPRRADAPAGDDG